MDLNEAYNETTMYLEPRLQEYIRRKRFNKENNITPNIPEEKEFCITSYDKKIIKRHKEGKNRIYDDDTISKDPHFVKASGKFEFEDHDFKKDPRYRRLQRKMASHKKAREAISNYSNMDDCYTHFHNSNPYDLRQDKRPQRISKPYDNNDEISNSSDNYDPMNQHENGFLLDSRDLVLASDRTSATNYQNSNRGKYCYSPNQVSCNESSYHHTPKISYRNTLIHEKVNGGLEHNHSVNDIVDDLNDYRKHLDNTYTYLGDQLNHQSNSHKVNLRGRENNRRNVPFQYGNGFPNITLEDSLRGGFRDSSKKSIGFRNAFENQFQYISSDISDPNHTVQMYPQNSRGQNKEIARPNSRSIKSQQRFNQGMSRQRMY